MPKRLTLLLAMIGVAVAAGAPTTSAATPSFHARWVAFEGHRLYVRDYPGRGPALVLMHGFPDNLHLYDMLVPRLRGRHIVTFDFLGWGRSDKPAHYDYTFAEQERELAAVVRALRLTEIIPVVHDASGPAGINWAVAHPARVAALILLNTFYSVMPTVNPPEAIRFYSDPAFRHFAAALTKSRAVEHWIFDWQVGRFMSNPTTRKRVLDELWPEFIPALPAFASLNRDLAHVIQVDTAKVDLLHQFNRPVRIIFGGRDPYLNRGMARSFHALLPTSDLFLLPARHYVQIDDPARVAELIESVPTAGAITSAHSDR